LLSRRYIISGRSSSIVEGRLPLAGRPLFGPGSFCLVAVVCGPWAVARVSEEWRALPFWFGGEVWLRALDLLEFSRLPAEAVPAGVSPDNGTLAGGCAFTPPGVSQRISSSMESRMLCK